NEGLSLTDASALGAVYRDSAWRLLDVNLRVERDGADVFVTGELRAAVSQACGRCLEPSPGEVTAPVDVRLVPRPVTADNVKLAAPTRSVCPQCRETKLPHRVCPHCGYYKGREIVAVEGT